jgi:cell division protein FtsB
MSLGQTLTRRAKLAVAPAVFLAITGYFGWSATRGDHGLVASAQREVLLKQVQADQIAAQQDHDLWERRVIGLRSNHLNPDTLDERARAMLNLADPTDVVVQYAPKDKLF